MSRVMSRLLCTVLLVAVGGSCAKKSSDASTADCRAVSGTAVTLVARNVAWDTKCLRLKPGMIDFTVDNRDSSVAHNLHVTGNGVDQKTKLVTGPVTQRLLVDLRRAGRYTFVCDIHADMEGTLVVG